VKLHFCNMRMTTEVQSATGLELALFHLTLDCFREDQRTCGCPDGYITDETDACVPDSNATPEPPCSVFQVLSKK